MKSWGLSLLTVTKTSRYFNFKPAFTIVELLVVIVVIGILATITTVSFSGISQKATIASLKSDLTNASKILKIDQVTNMMFPSTLEAANSGKGIQHSSGTIYSYVVNNNITPQSFCLSATKDLISYITTENGDIIQGNCDNYLPVLFLDASSSISYQGSGTSWLDLSGNNNHGTLLNGIGYSETNGGELIFDGINDYATIPTLEFTTDEPWSYSVSLLTNSGWSSNWRNIIGGPADVDSMWLLHSGSGLIFYQDYYNTTWIWYTNLLPASVPVDVFYNLVISCEPVSTYQTKFKLYLNSTLISQSSFNWSNRLSLPKQTFSRIGGIGINNRYYPGKIQSVSIYNRVLSQQDVNQNYNNQKWRYEL